MAMPCNGTLRGSMRERLKRSEYIETTGYEIYGSPNEQTLEMMREYASKLGVELAVQPDNMAGYIRVGSSRR
jgi:hypothetical protein